MTKSVKKASVDLILMVASILALGEEPRPQWARRAQMRSYQACPSKFLGWA